ncbi:MAG: hypothetical protein QXU20_02575 [Candidatus Woesearchaeota archaeon]
MQENTATFMDFGRANKKLFFSFFIILKISDEKIKGIVKEFNYYREPEIRAEFLSLKNNILRIKFFGSFCKSCGFYDYFEDFIIKLEENKIKAKLKNIKELKDKVIVDFEIKN